MQQKISGWNECIVHKANFISRDLENDVKNHQFCHGRLKIYKADLASQIGKPNSSCKSLKSSCFKMKTIFPGFETVVKTLDDRLIIQE